MNKFLKKNLLLISVFITGACILVVEVVAVRVLSPYYGNTIFTVSSVISVILASLSLGYYIGGKFADRHPTLKWFFTIIMFGGIILLALYFLGMILLPVLSVSLPFATGPLYSSIIFYFFPTLLLGMLSPFAVKLQSVEFPEQGIGSISGKIFFWSTLGSILGSLFSGFFLIPNFSIDYIFISTGLVLFILGFIPLAFLGFTKKRLYQSVLSILVLTFLNIYVVEKVQSFYLYSKDGIYEKIHIYDGIEAGRPARFFQQDRSSSGAMFLDSNIPTDLVYEYTKYYSIYKIFKSDIQNILVIGGGAYSIPKALLTDLPNANIDVSEIEPSLYVLAQKYFDLVEDSRLQNFTTDGRLFLKSSNKKYDMIFSDVYYSLFSIPTHFTTKEFFTIVKDRLSEDGIFVGNLIGDLSRQSPSFIMSEIKTFKSVFPNTYFFAVVSPESVDVQNIIFVGYNSSKKINLDSDMVLGDQNPIISSLRDKIINIDRFNLSSYPVLTDNFSPTEYLTSKVLERTFGDRKIINGKEVLALVNQQLSYGPRYIGSQGHSDVQKFITTEMRETTSEVISQKWDYVGIDGKIHTLTNIIGRTYPLQKRRIILGTHYDSKKLADKDWLNSIKPVPGANDSASGVAVLLELARVLHNSEKIPDIGIDFVFFDGEEGDENQGGDYTNWKPLGSTFFAENLDKVYTNKEPISGIILDMVCDKDLKIYKERSSVQNAPTQVNAFWDIAKKVDSSAFSDEVSLEIQDDHTPLNQVGIPTFLLIDYGYSPFHTTKDTLDKCSAKSLETVAGAVFNYIYSIH